MMLKLEHMLEQHLKDFYPDVCDLVQVELWVNQESQYGQFSSNIGFKLSQLLPGSPLDHALQWANTLPQCKELKEMKAFPPGYLNFYFATGFEHQVIKECLALPSFQYQQGQMLQKGYAFFIAQCLKNIASYMKLDFISHENDIHGFHALAHEHVIEALGWDDIEFEHLIYAYQRNALVLSYLNELPWLEDDFLWRVGLSGQAKLVFDALLVFESLLCRTVKQQSLPILGLFLKNLASRMHCLYNEVTLYSGDLQKDLMHRYLLQACQKILRLSFDLLGICQL